MKLSIIYKVSFGLAAIDLWLAAICAATGDIHFVAFMILAGLMWANGIYFKKKAEEVGE